MEFKEQWKIDTNFEITNKGNIKREIDWIIKKLKANLEKYGEAYPAPATKDGKYPIIENREWTTSFWTGMLWMAYEYSNDDTFLKAAKINTDSFINRLNTRYEIEHHDIGFLYTLSTVAGYKVTGEDKYRLASLKAADLLCERFIDKAGFIQAWGDKLDESENRAIIDSLLNIPLLFWATEESGDEKYRTIATRHFNTVIKHIIREDSTTYHTYYFDYEDGTPLYGKTRQGYADNSCWARGQAWAIYGQMLAYKYLKDDSILASYDRVLEYFVANLPNDTIAYWDLVFSDDNPSDRDSSSNAIALCGLLEHLKLSKDQKEEHSFLIKAMLTNLQASYTTENDDSEGILKHGVYSWHSGRGVDEANIWGDYFYLEALYRIYANRWDPYW